MAIFLRLFHKPIFNCSFNTERETPFCLEIASRQQRFLFHALHPISDSLQACFYVHKKGTTFDALNQFMAWRIVFVKLRQVPVDKPAQHP